MKEFVKTNKKRIASVIALTVVGLGQFVLVDNANATFPVVEVGPSQVWNFISQMENTATAAQTLESYKQQVTDAMNNFTQLSQLPQSLINSGMSLNDLNVYRFNVSQLLGSVQNLQQLETNLQQQYSVSGATSWDQFYTNQQKGVANGDALATQNYQRARQIQDDIQTQYDQINKNQAAVSAITGTQSGFQAVASQLQLLTKQNAQMLEMLSAKQTNASIKDKTEALLQKQTATNSQADMKDAQQRAKQNLQLLREMDPSFAAKFSQ
jgi:hypothetical protein